MRNKLWLLSVILLSSSTSFAAEKKKKLSLQDLLKSSSKNSSSSRSATVAGVRGLDETGSAIDTQARDFVAVERMEKFTVTPEQLSAFIAEGKLK